MVLTVAMEASCLCGVRVSSILVAKDEDRPGVVY